MARFEYRPAWRFDRNMTIAEVSEMTGVLPKTIKERIGNEGIKITEHVGNRKYYKAKDIDKVMNSPAFRENWIINGYTHIKAIAQLLECSNTHVLFLLNQHNMQVKRQRIYGFGGVWVLNDDVYKLQALENKSRTKPDDSYISLKELAQIIGVSVERVRQVVSANNINAQTVYRQMRYFDEETADRIERLFTKKAPGQHKIISEAERKKHPLVKDLRCFEFSFFPAAMPLCFEDLE